MSIERAKLDRACTQLSIGLFDDDDYIFLQEYHQILTPVTRALKLLEGSKHAFGLYLPVLLGLRRQLVQSKETVSALVRPLAVAIENGFESRFAELLDIFDIEGLSAPLYIAMASNPQFKLNYLGFERVPRHKAIKIQQLLLAAGKEILNEERMKQRSVPEANTQENDRTRTIATNDAGTSSHTNIKKSYTHNLIFH